jgi:hypothetical protein
MNAQGKKVQRVRSPNYPNYGLKECITFLERLYKKYGTSEIHAEDAITQMGHSPTSSTAGRVLASMFSFGLLESRGAKDSKFVRLSRLSQEILLEDESSSKRTELLQKAAINDSSMQEIFEKWGTDIPAEETIKKSLQLEMNYSPEGAKRFSSVIVDTYDFAQMSKALAKVPNEGPEYEEENFDETKDKSEEKLSPSVRKANLLLPGANREILIYAPADLTEIEFELIFKWLELQKYGLVSPAKKDDNDGRKQEQG